VLSADVRASFDDLLDALADLQRFNENFEAAVENFADVLLPESAWALLAGKQRVIVSPHRRLHLFPFHALRRDGKRLIEHFAVSYTPNLGMLLTPPRPHRERRVLVAGVSAFDVPATPLTALPGIDAELDAVVEVNRDTGIETTVLRNEAVTRGMLQQLSDSGELERYSTILLAMHGNSILGEKVTNAPMESYVYLRDRRLDGLEISRLHMSADLVVLSACFSGQRATGGRDLPELPGDDLFGLQAAFNIAGARAVLACLWPASEAVAPGIIRALFQELASGTPPDVALQRAILDHLARGDRTDSYYWAPFFITSMAHAG
jgi:CHAT domain-containing protein